MPGTKTPIGETMYAFHHSSKTYRGGDCVISAHGGRAIHPRSFVVPDGVTIHFYVPKGFAGVSQKSYNQDLDRARDGASMSVALNHTLVNAVPIQETASAGMDCPNYNFSKLQAEETVDGKLPYRESDIIKFFSNYVEARDIITVRHRRAYGELDLETVVRLTRVNGLAYTTFHCVFCRGPALFPDKGDFQIVAGFDGTFKQGQPETI